MKNYNTAICKILVLFILFQCILFINSISAQIGTSWEVPLKRCWINQLPNSSTKLVASDNNNTNSNYSSNFYLLSKDLIQNFNSQSGKIIWETKVSGRVISEPIIIDDKVFYISESIDEINYLNSVDGKTGLSYWKTEISFGTKLHEVFDSSSDLLITRKEIIASINKSNGRLKWTTLLDSEITSLKIVEDSIYLTTGQKRILVISSLTGKIKNEIKTRSINTNIVRNIGTQIFWADNKGTVEAFNLSNKRTLWIRKMGGGISKLSLKSDILYISSLDNFIYLLNTKNGKILLRKRLDGRILNDPAIQDQIYAISSYNSLQIFLLDIKNKKIINQIRLSDAEAFVESFIFNGKFLIVKSPKNISSYSYECQKGE